MFRRHPRLFKTVKICGMTYRLTRNVWWDFRRQMKTVWLDSFRQFKKLWKEPTVIDPDLVISKPTDNRERTLWN